MGLIAAALNAAGGTLASQWKEYFYVDALPDKVPFPRHEPSVLFERKKALVIGS